MHGITFSITGLNVRLNMWIMFTRAVRVTNSIKESMNVALEFYQLLVIAIFSHAHS